MRLLAADDDKDYTALLRTYLQDGGYEVDCVHDGATAWEHLRVPGYQIAILDWEMPRITGPELCNKVRGVAELPYTYLIVVTAKAGREHYLEAMRAGADDFLPKPVDFEVLHARLKVAQRMLAMCSALQRKGGFLTICIYCDAVHDQDEEWEPIEQYVAESTGARLSHGCCPNCLPRLRADMG